MSCKSFIRENMIFLNSDIDKKKEKRRKKAEQTKYDFVHHENFKSILFFSFLLNSNELVLDLFWSEC